MRILYIAFENPAVDTILGGMHDETLSGLPAFYYPFKLLLERGHTVDMLLYSAKDYSLVESEYFKKENFIQIKPRHRGLLGSLELPIRLGREAKKLLKAWHYDFVYGMSEGAHMGVRAAAKMGIPCALRQFGTQEMANVLEPMKGRLRRWFRALKDYTYITLSMISRKSFILATNDGSRADELYDILGVKKKKFDFYFWRSAVAIPSEQPVVDTGVTGEYPSTYDPMCLSLVNRITDVKRQDRGVRILHELHKRGYPFHMYFVGTGNHSGSGMYNTVVRLAGELSLSDYIHFEGGKPQAECHEYARNSFATLQVGEWNRVNILYEEMGQGCLIVTNNNHSVDEYVENGFNCVMYDDEGEAAERIIELMRDPEKCGLLRRNAHLTAKEKFLSLDKRFGMEVQLVLDTAEGKKSGFPPVI